MLRLLNNTNATALYNALVRCPDVAIADTLAFEHERSELEDVLAGVTEDALGQATEEEEERLDAANLFCLWRSVNAQQIFFCSLRPVGTGHTVVWKMTVP